MIKSQTKFQYIYSYVQQCALYIQRKGREMKVIKVVSIRCRDYTEICDFSRTGVLKYKYVSESPGRLVKQGAGIHPRGLVQGGLSWAPGICISNEFQVMLMQVIIPASHVESPHL